MRWMNLFSPVLALVVPSYATTLVPGETATYTFSVAAPSTAAECDGVCDGLLFQSDFENPAGLLMTFRLFNGNTLLGTFSTNAAVITEGASFETPGSLYGGDGFGPSALADLSVIAGGTTSGRIDVSVTGGSLQSYPAAVGVILGHAFVPAALNDIGRNPAFITGSTIDPPPITGDPIVPPVNTGVTIVSPEPSSLVLALAGVSLIVGLQSFRKRNERELRTGCRRNS